MRLLIYGLGWVGCVAVLGGCWAAIATLALFGTVLGPLGCVYVAARVGALAGGGYPACALLMLAALGLFAAVHADLWRAIARRHAALRRLAAAADALRADLWRQYRQQGGARS